MPELRVVTEVNVGAVHHRHCTVVQKLRVTLSNDGIFGGKINPNELRVEVLLKVKFGHFFNIVVSLFKVPEEISLIETLGMCRVGN